MESQEMDSDLKERPATPKRVMRPRAGTYAGYTSVESTKIHKILKTEPKPEESEKGDKLGINKLLTEKRKFSRQNRWGNCSYKQMIVHAISNSEAKKMTLNEIYDWIVANIPLFKGDQETNSSVGWKNSIRHNLSLHSIFVKEQQSGTKSIGAYWKLDLSREKAGGRRRANTMDPESRPVAVQRRKVPPRSKKGRLERESSRKG